MRTTKFVDGGFDVERTEKKGQANRSKIAMGEPHEVKYWTKRPGVSQQQLQKAVDKVGNSAAAVRKELAA